MRPLLKDHLYSELKGLSMIISQRCLRNTFWPVLKDRTAFHNMCPYSTAVSLHVHDKVDCSILSSFWVNVHVETQSWPCSVGTLPLLSEDLSCVQGEVYWWCSCSRHHRHGWTISHGSAQVRIIIVIELQQSWHSYPATYLNGRS